MALAVSRNFLCGRSPKIIRYDTPNSSRPPAIWNAGRPMASLLGSIQLPKRASQTMFPEALTGARSAIISRSFSEKPWVAETNDGTNPRGSTTTSSVTKAEMAKSTRAIRTAHNIG
jgi:hypothetical protein